MANRYWVRNAVGNWNNTANWSTSSAATTGGASVPTTGDVALFNANALAGNCTVDISPTVQSVNMTGYTGTLTFNSAGNFITITTTGTIFTGSTSATIVRSGSSVNGTNIRTLGTTTATKTITTGAVSESNALNFDISGVGTYALGTGSFGSLIINATTTFTSITVYGDYRHTSQTVAPNSGTIITMLSSVSVAATAMVVGTTYTITGVGTTDFTLYGAAENIPNTVFVATGSGTGTGTVTPTRFITSASNNFSQIIIGNGSIRGCVALSSVQGFDGGLQIVSGFFNNRGYGIIMNSGSFDYNNSFSRNIKITHNPATAVSGVYTISSGSGSFVGSNFNSTVDFSTAILNFVPGINKSYVFSYGMVVGSVRIANNGFLNPTVNLGGDNITFKTLDISQTVSGGYRTTVTFDSGANVYVGNLKIYSVPTSINISKLIKSSSSGTPFTLNKIGGGCDYFPNTTIQDCTGAPANTWYANTTVPVLPYVIPPMPSYSYLFPYYLGVANNAAFDFGSENWTIEFWVNSAYIEDQQQAIYNKTASIGGLSPIYLYLYPDIDTGRNSLGVLASTGGSGTFNINLVSKLQLPNNQWSHIAVVRNGTTIQGYINGYADPALLSSNATGVMFANTAGVSLGSSTINAYDTLFIGYMSNLRVVKGTAVYTGGFTPSTTPLTTTSQGVTASQVSLLTCQSPTIVDNSPNNFTIINYGARPVILAPFSSPPVPSYFNELSAGSFSAPDNAAFDFGSGNWTIETWVKRTSGSGFSTYTWFYSKAAGMLTGQLGPVLLSMEDLGNNEFYFQVNLSKDGNNYQFSKRSITPIPFNTWTHVAIVRNGTTIQGYINGYADPSLSDTEFTGALVTNTELPQIGKAYNGAGALFGGALSNFRIVKGTAVYTSNFTPSTTPLTAISGTSLLTCQSSTIVDNSANGFTLTPTGTVVVSATTTPTPAATPPNVNEYLNALYFGQNVDAGGNTNINFTQYPALGGFNEFF